VEENKDSNELKKISWIAGSVCFLFLSAYLIFHKQQFIIDNNVLILLFVGIGLFYIPSIARVIKRFKFYGFEIELHSVEFRTLLGEVVQDENGVFYYLEKGHTAFILPDTDTANILKSYKGFLKISKAKLKDYELKTMESAKTGDLLRLKEYGDVYIILNKKKYYISSYSTIRDMKRRGQIRDVDEDTIDKYETGR